MKKNGSEIFVESLRHEGVKTVFGLPGGVVLKLFDVLCQQKDIELVLTRHEQGAAHMAEGYAKATGKVGVVLVTSGPGMTNIVTGLADAYMDSVPIVAFTGQVSTNLIGNDAFQEADNVGISRPCTKHNVLVKDVNDLARTIKEAFYIAASGRPGPVLVDIPKDVSTDIADFKYPDKINLRGYNPTIAGNKHQIKQAAEEIMRAKKPIIYVGGGALFSDASDEILELAEITQIPVTMTLMGLGSFPGTHPLSLGMLGMHGGYWTNMAMHHSDLLIAVGARFDDRVTGKLSEFCPEARVIHIDIDPTSIKKTFHAHIPIVGDVKTVLRQMNVMLRSMDGNPAEMKALRGPWLKQVDALENFASVDLQAGRQDRKTAVRDRQAVRAYQSRSDCRHRRRPAPDVRRTVLQGLAAANLDYVRRFGDHGFWISGRIGRPEGVSRSARPLHHERRQLSDESPGTRSRGGA